MAVDELALGARLVRHFRDNMPELADVFVLLQLADVVTRVASSPSLVVVYDGDEVVGASGAGETVLVRQRWLLILAVRNASPDQSDLGADAGPLLGRVRQLMAGAVLAPSTMPARRINGPKPVYLETGFAYYPTAYAFELASPCEQEPGVDDYLGTPEH